MLETYPAILRNDHIEWVGDGPRSLPPERGVRVHVTLLDPAIPAPPGTTPGQRMAAALERLAAAGGLSQIADPAAWEREARQDRPLPGRDD